MTGAAGRVLACSCGCCSAERLVLFAGAALFELNIHSTSAAACRHIFHALPCLQDGAIAKVADVGLAATITVHNHIALNYGARPLSSWAAADRKPCWLWWRCCAACKTAAGWALLRSRTSPHGCLPHPALTLQSFPTTSRAPSRCGCCIVNGLIACGCKWLHCRVFRCPACAIQAGGCRWLAQQQRRFLHVS